MWESTDAHAHFCFPHFAFDVTLWYHHVVRLVSSVRQRKDELEQRMSTLQESRRELMVQLEQLMMLLKVPQTCLSSLWLHRIQLRRLHDYWTTTHSVSCGERHACGDFVSSLLLCQDQFCRVWSLHVYMRLHGHVYCSLYGFFVVAYFEAGGKQYGQLMNFPCITISPSCGQSLQLM